MTIYIDNSQCGSGKTHRLCSKSKTNLHKKQKTIIVCPSIDLINETYDRLQNKNVDDGGFAIDPSFLIAIHSQNTKKISGTIEAALNNTDERIILITHQSFMQHKWDKKCNNVNLIIDEALATYTTKRHTYSTTYNEICKVYNRIFNFTKVGGYYEVTLCDSEQLEDYDTTINDNRSIVELIKYVKNPNYNVYILADKVNEIKESKTVEGNKQKKIDFFIVLKESIIGEFKEVSIYGAKIIDSLMLRMWDKLTVNDKINQFNHHDRPINIYYANMEHYSISTNKKSPEIREAVVEHIKDNAVGEVIYIVNNDGDISISEYSTKLKHNNQGICEHKHVNNVACLSALNYSTAHAKFLQDMFNIPYQEATEMRHLDTFYQTIMRTSLRVEDSTDTVNVWVMGESIAESLKSGYFPNAKLIKINTPEKGVPKGRGKGKKTPLSIEEQKIRAAERNKAMHIRKLFDTLKDTKTENMIDLLPYFNSRGKLVNKNDFVTVNKMIRSIV